jgi:hypothetical protein
MTDDSRWVDFPDGNAGLWFPTPHGVTYVDRHGVRRDETARMAGTTLIWTSGVVTYRLEGHLTLDEATAIAKSVQ